jgi:hypothetical protein
MRTSVCSRTPFARCTSSCTRSIRVSTSAAVAAPWLMMKLACFTDTDASPIRRPFNPVASIRRAA